MSILTESPRERNMATIGLIAMRFGVTRYDVIGPRRTAPVVGARRACAGHFRDKGFSFPAIGKILNRDHTTIINLLNPKSGRVR